MGLSKNSVGKAASTELVIKKEDPNDIVIALAGNPNVGKSTLFNSLTGMNQHTGNWPGKTVTNACGRCQHDGQGYIFVDIPGTYSLMANSVEEEVARDFICFGEPDAVVVVCDATCLERNLNLLLQTLESTSNVVLCINLMDEAKKKGIKIDAQALKKKLQIPVITMTARGGKEKDKLFEAIEEVVDKKKQIQEPPVRYLTYIEKAIEEVMPFLEVMDIKNLSSRWLTLRLIENNEEIVKSIIKYLGFDITQDYEIKEALEKVNKYFENKEITNNKLKDNIVSCLILRAEELCIDVVLHTKQSHNKTDRKIDKILTSKWAGIPIMLLMLAAILWITIVGANYPSSWLSSFFGKIEGYALSLFEYFSAPAWLSGIIVEGMLRVLFWVVAVMLPPMAIFFPLFTLLEDLGYLPRVAFNLDRLFKRAGACGKQSLTMCMGFGCNAAGVIGCRIIDSPRERLIAIITNNFVPCNGRFPILISVITIFFVGGSIFSSLRSALFLTGIILLGILMTLFASRLLSKTLLKGVPSSFTLELPPYRKPQIGSVIVRSIFDRTLFVLGRAIAVAAPAGIIIWLAANIQTGSGSILQIVADFLDPFAQLMGMDGIILTAFILGLPANETVIPIIIMAYLSTGTLAEVSTASLAEILSQNGWTALTAISVMIFTLMHWPCSTTLISIKKETQSLKWTAVAFLLPTIIGIICCILLTTVWRLFI